MSDRFIVNAEGKKFDMEGKPTELQALYDELVLAEQEKKAYQDKVTELNGLILEAQGKAKYIASKLTEGIIEFEKMPKPA
jgi:hypothetical protein